MTSLFQVVLFMAWGIALMYLVVGSAFRLSLLGAFTAPVVFLILAFAQLAPLDRAGELRGERNPWIELHAALSLIAFGAFALAAVAGFMYLVQDRQLKNRRGGALLFNMPPIMDLSVANIRLLRLGTALLTAGFAAGFLIGIRVDPAKFWASAAIWLLYATMLVLRKIHSLPPRRTAVLSIAAFGVVLCALPFIQHLSYPK